MKIPEVASVVPRIHCVIPETRWVLSRPRCHEGRRGVVGHRDCSRIRDTPTPPGCRVYVTHPTARTCTNRFAEPRDQSADARDLAPTGTAGRIRRNTICRNAALCN